MKAIITIDMDGDAFADADGRELERILLLQVAGNAIRLTRLGMPWGMGLHDINGNTCGRFEIVD